MKRKIIEALVFLCVAIGLQTCGDDSTNKQTNINFPEPNWSYTTPKSPTLDTLFQTDSKDSEHWKEYKFFDAISISVPKSVELRDNSSKYKESLSALGVQDNIDAVVFNQRGLNDMEQQALEKYCRIMLTIISGEYGDFFNRNETEKFSEDDVLFLAIW